MYRVAERAHILCTASWSQVAKCVPIHSLNITTSVGLVLSVIVFGVFRGPKSENSSKDMRPKELGAALR